FFSVLAALTLLPAILGVLGPRIDALAVVVGAAGAGGDGAALALLPARARPAPAPRLALRARAPLLAGRLDPAAQRAVAPGLRPAGAAVRRGRAGAGRGGGQDGRRQQRLRARQPRRALRFHAHPRGRPPRRAGRLDRHARPAPGARAVRAALPRPRAHR